MKVVRVGANAQGQTIVSCRWYVAGAQQEADFRPGQLRAYTPEEPDVANPPLGS